MIGVRPLRDSEYVTSATVRNSTSVPSTVNFRVTGAVVGEADPGGVTSLHSLTFSGSGSSLTLAPEQKLQSSHIMVQANATNAVLAGGRLSGPGNVYMFHVHGDLTMSTPHESIQFGQGTLIKYGGGTMRAGADELFSHGLVNLELQGGTYDLAGTTQTMRQLGGAAGTTVNVNGGILEFDRAPYAGSITGGGLIRGRSGTFTGTSSFSGSFEHEAVSGNLFTTSLYASTLSQNGRWTNLSELTLGPRAQLRLENARGYSSAQRLPTGLDVRLASSAIEYTGSPVDAIADSFGKLTVVGGSSLVLPAGGVGRSVTFASLERIDDAALRILAPLATQDVGGPLTRYTTYLKFAGGLPTISDPNGSAGGQNTGVVPFLQIDAHLTGSGGHFATYDSDGVRMLSATDSKYFAQVRAGQNLSGFQFRNVHLVGNPAAVSGAVRVNSLHLNSSAIIGAGPGAAIQVYSGLVGGVGGSTFDSVALDFGDKVGYLLSGATFAGTADVRGSAGLVVSGTYSSSIRSAVFNNVANSFAGGLKIYNASVAFSSDAQLGAAGGGVSMEYGALVYSGTGTASVSSPRTVRLGEAHGAFEVADAAGSMIVNAKVSGQGDLYKVGAGTLVLGNSANDYAGATVLLSGTTRLTADALPNSTAVYLGTKSVATGATLDLAGNDTTISGLRHAFENTAGTANVVTNSAASLATLTIDSAANWTYDGAFGGNLKFVKAGSGRFTT
ncbi:MAG TPA: hypothetical protein VNC50_05760, partial [Planctomycetia bacterium]|nr:hypothetical protein [Planctomycetia bacterium]